VISLIANLALYLTGKGQFTSVVLDAISVTTFGLGRVASSAAKVSYRGMRGAARIAVGRAASRPQAGQTSSDLLAEFVPQAAGMSRRAARATMRFADTQGLFPSLAKAGRSLRSAGPEFVASLDTLRDTDWGKVIRNVPGDFGATFSGTTDDGVRAFFSKLYGDPESAKHAIGHLRLADAIRTDAKVAKYATHAVAQHMTQIASGLTGSGVDGYQGYQNVSGLWSDEPSLNLPAAPSGAL